MGNSHQRGWVVLRSKKWYGYHRKTVLDPTTNEQRVQIVPVILGLKSQLTKFQARERLEQQIAKQNGQTPGGRVMNDGAVTFGWFVRNRFFPLKEAKWRPETAKVKKLIIQKDLIDAFDSIPLENFDRFTLQVHLNKLGVSRSKDRVLQIKAYMKTSLLRQSNRTFSPRILRARSALRLTCARRTRLRSRGSNCGTRSPRSRCAIVSCWSST